MCGATVKTEIENDALGGGDVPSSARATRYAMLKRYTKCIEGLVRADRKVKPRLVYGMT